MNQSGATTENQNKLDTLSSSGNNIPLFIQRYLGSLDPGFEIVKIIRDKYPRLILRANIEERDCLVKAVRSLTLWKKPGRYFRFQKEIFIYSQLEKLEFRHFHYPGLTHTDGKRILITDFVENDPGLPADQNFYDSAFQAILELNACGFPCEKRGGPGWTWEKINRWKFSRSTKTLRNLLEGFFIRRKVPLSLFMKILSFWAGSISSSTKLKKPLLVHRDIFRANIRRPDKSRVYFIDFEKMGLEKRWVFVDALKIAQAEPLFFEESEEGCAGFPRFHIRLLEGFWEKLVFYRQELGPDKGAFKLQLRFCLLGWTLKKLVKEKVSSLQRLQLVGFLERVILARGNEFEDWLEKCPR